MELISSGLLLYRTSDDASSGVELLIAHMGGPYFEHKENETWSIPKGLIEPGEDDLIAVAEREFEEEMGSKPTPGESIELGHSMSGKKKVVIFAREGTFDLSTFHSTDFEMEWPKGSGNIESFPEVDRADWVTPVDARRLLVKSQVVFVDRLLEVLDKFDRVETELA